jgi:hypothetical protein
MSFILVFVSKRIPSAGSGVEGDEDDDDKDDLLGTLELFLLQQCSMLK